ncbi:MAG: IS200/IS605 family transposase, partial [Acidobacteriaceae bacterium]
YRSSKNRVPPGTAFRRAILKSPPAWPQMAHTYAINHLHVVFSTKHRKPMISPEWENELHAIFHGIAREKKFGIDCSGGMEDHVHVMVQLPAKLDLSRAVQFLKANSSRWAKPRRAGFMWQEGFSAFSVSASGLDQVRRYIGAQKDRHPKMSFEDELRALLRKHGIKWEEQYLLERMPSLRDSNLMRSCTHL